MGQKLRNILTGAQNRLGEGVLQSIGLTRLKYIIGNEVLKKAQELDDNPALLELIKQGVSSLENEQQLEEFTGKSLPQGAQPESTPPDELEIAPQAQSDAQANHFVLKLKKNNTNGQVELFSSGILFLPVALENELLTLFEDETANTSGEEIFSLGKECGHELLAGSLPLQNKETAIRSGLALLRSMGYVRYRVRENTFPWSIDLISSKSHSLIKEFIRGYLHALFELVYKTDVSVTFGESSTTKIIEGGFMATIEQKNPEKEKK